MATQAACRGCAAAAAAAPLLRRRLFCPVAALALQQRGGHDCASSSTYLPTSTPAQARVPRPALPQVFDEDQVKMMEELCIVTDLDDKVVGADTKKNVHLIDGPCMKPGGLPHRAFSAFVFNQKNGEPPPSPATLASAHAPECVGCATPSVAPALPLLHSVCRAVYVCCLGLSPAAVPIRRAADAAALRPEDPLPQPLGQHLLLSPPPRRRALPRGAHLRRDGRPHRHHPRCGPCCQPASPRTRPIAVLGGALTPPPTPPCPRVQRRKLRQELGVPPSQLPADCFQFITRVHYKAPMPGPEPMWGEHEIDYLLIARPEVCGHLPRPGAPRAGPR
eukprot:COSAG01_NODE_4521_length_4958_cov_8.531385_2_plen_334_part_00